MLFETNPELLYEDKTINDYFYKKLVNSTSFESLPDDLKEDYISDVVNMSRLGVSSSKEEKLYFIILNCVEDVLIDLLKRTPNPHLIALVSSYVFNHREDYPFETCPDLFSAVSNALRALDIPFEKRAYPMGYTGYYEAPKYNVNKWMNATRDIYLKAKNIGYNEAVSLITKSWDKMETENFKRWLKIYQDGVPTKYKIAQKYYENSENGFFIPNNIDFDSLRAKLPKSYSPAPEKSEENKTNDVNDARVRIEDQRHKIISRLNSAEKLLASMEGQFFAGDDQEFMLKLLQDLKRKIQTSNKLSVRSSLFEDYIYRTGNLLYSLGNEKGRNFFYKIAQDESLLEGLEDLGEPKEGDEPVSNEPNSKVKNDTLQALKEFFEGLSTGVSGDPDDTAEERKEASEHYDLFVEAQAQEEIPIGEAEPSPQKPRVNPTLHEKRDLFSEEPAQPSVPNQVQQAPMTQESQESETPEVTEDATDDTIEAALNNITIQDVISRVEMLVNIYNKREITRQINILDIMMDKIGIASYFPAMGEAMQKALEANQYISTRLSDILSKLKGSIESPMAQEWTNVQKETTPENDQIRQNLQKQDDEEDALKEKRKEKEKERLTAPKEEKQVPTNELEGNIPVAQPTATPAR